MALTCRGRLCRTSAVLMAVIAALFLMVRGVTAGDPERPIGPLSAVAPTLSFGNLAITPNDVSGSSIDARETVEPQLTVLATMDDLEVSPSETMVVNMQPVFSSQVASE